MRISEEGKRVSDFLTTWITIGGLLVGGIFAGYQYLAAKKRDRIERTTAYFTRFSESTVLQHRLLLNQSSNQLNPQIRKTLTAKNKSQNEISSSYERLVRTSINKDINLQEAVISIMDSLEAVAICVQQALCEESVTKAYFGRYGQSFFRQYYPFICELRGKWNDPSRGLSLETYFNPGSVGKSCSGS